MVLKMVQPGFLTGNVCDSLLTQCATVFRSSVFLFAQKISLWFGVLRPSELPSMFMYQMDVR